MQRIYEPAQAEIERKKSRFICQIAVVKSPEEANAFLATVKKEHWDARHHCSAYIIGRENPLMHCSDDGEPAQTAGRPMLDLLLAEEMRDICLVVTRYFGGTLLGTGGLVRAYTDAAKAGLLASKRMLLCKGIPLRMYMDYGDYGKISYQIAEEGHKILEQDFGAEVVLRLLLRPEQKEAFCQKVRDLTAGRCRMQEEDVIEYGDLEGEVIWLD